MEKNVEKTYNMQLIMGKEVNHDGNGKIRNQIVESKYTGELAMQKLIDKKGYLSLGACAIKCLGCWDVKLDKKKQRVHQPSEVDRINALIKKVTGKKKQPEKISNKELFELLQKNNEELKATQDELAELRKNKTKPVDDVKEDAGESTDGAASGAGGKEPYIEPVHEKKFKDMDRTELDAYAMELEIMPDMELKDSVIRKMIADKIKELSE